MVVFPITVLLAFPSLFVGVLGAAAASKEPAAGAAIGILGGFGFILPGIVWLYALYDAYHS